VKLPNFGYHLARAQGHAIRAAYNAALERIIARRINIMGAVSFDVCSYSGSAMLAEQVASIRSFLRHAGRPPCFTVYSDGSHSAREIDMLRCVDPSVEVQIVPSLPTNLVGEVAAYLDVHPTGKQLRLMMSLPLERPTLYADSDVLFFRGAAALDSIVSSTTAAALFLQDCQLSADERVFRRTDERSHPVNTGMILFNRKLDWAVALERLRQLNGAPIFHTNQTLTHVVMLANRAAPLDPRKFVLQLDDQFVYRDRYARGDIVARHYVNPVRHKFWTAVLR
jgi:hypothetical protein